MQTSWKISPRSGNRLSSLTARTMKKKLFTPSVREALLGHEHFQLSNSTVLFGVAIRQASAVDAFFGLVFFVALGP